MATRSRSKRTTKVKRVTFYRVHGGMTESRLDPAYREATGQPNLPAVEPDYLRYDLAFVNDSDPTLIAFVAFSSGYGKAEPTRAMWGASYPLRPVRGCVSVPEDKRVQDPNGDEVWNRVDLFALESKVKAGVGWHTYRHPNVRCNRSSPDYSILVKIPMEAFLALHPDQSPQEANPACPQCKGHSNGRREPTKIEQDVYGFHGPLWNCGTCGHLWERAGEDSEGR